MNHSDIVTELLHKLSKNELLQDGGKSNYYRSQLNSMIGRGPDEDRITSEIVRDIGELIPMSVLQEFVARAKQQIDTLAAEKTALQQEIAGLNRALTEGGNANQQQIAALEEQLRTARDQLAENDRQREELARSLAAKEQELTNAQQEIGALKANLQTIRGKVTEVKNTTSTSPILAKLLAQLSGPAAVAPSTSVASTASSQGSTE